jgi:tetratricopeptide (TPR) repeat protein
MKNLLKITLTCGSLCLIFGLAPITQAQNLQNQLDFTPRLNFNLEIRNKADQEVQLGSQALTSGNANQAITHWLEALRLYESLPDLDGIGRVSSYLGSVYVSVGDFNAAENAMRKSLAVARSRQDQYRQIAALNNLGTLLLETGRNLEETEALFKEALDIAQSVGDAAGKGLSISNLGRLAYVQGDYIQAIDLYKLALPYRYEGNDRLGQANTLNNLGDAYQATAEYWEAINAYRQAKVTAESKNDLDHQYRAFEGIAKCYGALGFQNRAFEFLNQWATLAIANEDLSQELNVTRLSAYFYAELGDQNNAVYFYEKAINLATNLGADQEVALLKNNLSQVLYRTH